MTPRAGALALLALGACGPRRAPPPPRPARCAAETIAGLRTRAVTWSRGAWTAAIPEGQGVSLRAFDDLGAVRGNALSILDEPVRPQDISIAATPRGVLVAAVTAMGDLRVLSVEGDAVRESREARASTDGDFALIPRPDEPSRPAALAYSLRGQTLLRLIEADGAPRGPATCPAGLSPRAIAAWQDGFVAATHGDGVTALALDDACRVLRRTPLSAAPSRGAPSVAVDGGGAVFAWTEDRAWVAGVDHEGAVPIRPTALEPDTAHAGLLLAADGASRRAEIRVIALRRNEIQSRMQLYRLDPRGTLRDVGGLAAAPAVRYAVTAADPWGGALLGWGRPEALASGAGASRALPFFTRVCP